MPYQYSSPSAVNRSGYTIINESETTDKPPRFQSSIVKYLLYFIAITCVVIVGSVSLSNKTSTSVESSSTTSSYYYDYVDDNIRGSDDNPDEEDNEDVDSNDDPVVESTIAFTVKRKDYDLLSFFSKKRPKTIKYHHLSAYKGLVEPYTYTELYLYDFKASDDGYVYEYEICNDKNSVNIYGDDILCVNGEYHSDDDIVAAYVECSPFDTLSITVYEKLDNVIVSSTTGTLLCQYVRREIRSLTDNDLQETMDAMHELWVTSEDEGQELYGEDYHSQVYFTEAHTFNAGQIDADHIHEGLGFLPQHIKITNMFEKAMQAVNPSVSLFYWDYTIETETNVKIGDSPMFTADTFGTLNFPADNYWGWTYSNDSIEDAAIPDGRWSHTTADLSNKYDLSNSFGYLRGPWNFNPSPYISRFSISTTALPSCKNYAEWLYVANYTEFLDYSSHEPHATTHGALGSIFGCDLFIPLLDAGLLKDLDSLHSTCKKWGFYMKDFYRSNLIYPSNDCTVTSLDYDGTDCSVGCPTDEELLEELSEDILNQVRKTSVPQGFDDWDSWRDWLCDGDAYKVFVGDHLESSSPSDPSFWPIHPNLERLYQLRLMAGGFDDYTWPLDAESVCNAYLCVEVDIAPNTFDYYDQCCYGHFENDQLLDFVNGDVNNGYGETNRETLDSTDPTSSTYSVNYIYDDLTFSHCEDYDFEDIAATLYDDLYN